MDYLKLSGFVDEEVKGYVKIYENNKTNLERTKMKTILIALSTLLFSFTNSPIDRLGVKGPLEFNKTNFKLAWTEKPSDIYYIQEYLPEGEYPERFNQMLTIHYFNTDLETKDAVGQKVKELTERKKTDAICNYQVTKSPDGKEFIVDFLLGESKDNKMTIVEFNVYRYKQIENFRKEKSIIVYAYSKRSYGDDITNFLTTLKDDRVSYLNAMISAEIPTVIIESN